MSSSCCARGLANRCGVCSAALLGKLGGEVRDGLEGAQSRVPKCGIEKLLQGGLLVGIERERQCGGGHGSLKLERWW